MGYRYMVKQEQNWQLGSSLLPKNIYHFEYEDCCWLNLTLPIRQVNYGKQSIRIDYQSTQPLAGVFWLFKN